MEQVTAEKILQLAKSLKEHHLAGTMEEAYARAKEIVLAAGETQEKSIKEILKATDIDENVNEVKEDYEKDVKGHKKEKKETNEIKQNIKKEKKESSNSIEDAEAIIEMSEKIQDYEK